MKTFRIKQFYFKAIDVRQIEKALEIVHFQFEISLIYEISL